MLDNLGAFLLQLHLQDRAIPRALSAPPTMMLVTCEYLSQTRYAIYFTFLNAGGIAVVHRSQTFVENSRPVPE